MAAFIKNFSEISIHDLALVGGKNASLGEMFSQLTPKGILVPDGFAVTAVAYDAFLKENQLHKPLDDLLGQLDKTNFSNLENHWQASACTDSERQIAGACRHSYPTGLSGFARTRRRRYFAGRAQQRHCGRPAFGQFCRTIGEFPEHQRRRALVDTVHRCFTPCSPTAPSNTAKTRVLAI
jgi:hypothetical protein